MRMSNKLGVFIGLLSLIVGVTATAGPGDGTVVVIDRPSEPDVLVQELRVENYDATHAPVTVRVAVPASEDGSAPTMRRAEVTVYLTSSLSDPEAPHLSETAVKLGPQWANRSVVIEVPSPGAGEYFVNLHATMEFEDRDDAVLDVSTTQRVRFGTPQNCGGVESVELPGLTECPLLFPTKSTALFDGQFDAANVRIMNETVEVLEGLCEEGALHRVSVRGWASTLYSDNPTNEELAQGRAKAVLQVLQNRLSKCSDRVFNDSVRGTRGATKQFGEDDLANQCAQVEITRHSCK